jgi:formylglycine-generating enzyme required for sulfatase activity/cellulose biosynthesis protein BcsQ
MISPSMGQIITFYSYKGGTGRTMALANIACLLAQRSKDRDILMIDWDLEAPGLHRFFQNELIDQNGKILSEQEVDARPGLLDFFLEVEKLIQNTELGPDLAHQVLDTLKLDPYLLRIGKKNLVLFKAGRADERYPFAVSRFNWENLYQKAPYLFQYLADILSDRFQFVLIDSRTGITDTSGICTMMMPEKLVVVFTPNRQSLTGATSLVRRALNYRRNSNDLRPLVVYPLPSRIEDAEDDLRRYWRYGEPQRNIVGYQFLFENLFKEVYGLDECALMNYFDKVAIRHKAYYLYGEEIAVLRESLTDVNVISQNYILFTNLIIESQLPWEVVLDSDKQSPNITIVMTPAEKMLAGKAGLNAYFRALAAECAELPMGLVDENFTSKDTVLLKDVYIDLDVYGARLDRKNELHLLRRELERPGQGRDNQRMSLIEVIAEEKTRRMVLLGTAGSGKTTFINYLTYVLANAYAKDQAGENLPEALQGLLPVRLVLRRVVGHIPLGTEYGMAEMLWNALEEDLKRRLGEEKYGLAWEQLQKEIREGRSLVLLDGLDEVPEAGEQRACLLQAVEDFLKALPKTQRVVLTARPYAYADPIWQLKGCEIFNLAPLSSEQVGRFVEQWYLSVRGSVNLDEGDAIQRAGQLAAAIEQRSYLADLASRPLLLTLMATLHSTGDDLPEDRADLYEKTVHLLLVRWQRGWVGSTIMLGDQAVQVDLTFVRQALAELAYETQRRQRGTNATEGPGDIPFGDLLAVFVKRLPKILPADLTAYLENRTGLLVEREPGLYCFAHRSFQEYLAACHLLDTSVELSADLRGLVDEDAAWWREVILLALGKTRHGSMIGALDLLRNVLLPVAMDECPKLSLGDWRAAALGGLGLAELRVKERQAELAEAPRNLPRARKWLVGVMERSGLPARERVEAGNTLAKLGDPRFDAERCYLSKDEMLGFIRIPGGIFWMGSDPKRDSQAEEKEQPQHAVEVPEFYIQRYPVTVAQFGVFVRQSGYRPREPRCLDGFANHPVVYVTWNDAVAYCQWLDGWMRENGPEGLRRRLVEGGRIRLPSEAEWEKAAREADGRIYPWGDDFDSDRANTSESGVGDICPVGSFPRGATPYGLLDMAGNVWEWTRDQFDSYPYDLQSRCGSIQSEDMHVVRGGAFYLNRGFARCAFRGRDNSNDPSGNIGFRIVVIHSDGISAS